MSKQEKQDAIVKAEAPGALATAKDLQQYAGAGTEGIGREDVRPPRLVLAQAGHPQTKRGNEKHIEGLVEGDLFNDLTNSKYAQPLKFVVIRYLGKRAVEFYPENSPERKAGNNIKDRNVKLDDKRCQPTTDKDGNWQPPVADIFADYLVYLPDTAEITTVTFKNADLAKKGAATQLNSLLRYMLKVDGVVLTSPPAWARTFELSSASKQGGGYTWSVYKLKFLGVTDADNRKIASEVFKQFSEAKVVIEDEPEAGEPKGNTGAADEDVPF